MVKPNFCQPGMLAGLGRLTPVVVAPVLKGKGPVDVFAKPVTDGVEVVGRGAMPATADGVEVVGSGAMPLKDGVKVVGRETMVLL
jgi:hypothetical protein